MINLAGKTAVVFGLANKRSIAWGIAQRLNQAGATLAICYQNERMKLEAEELIKDLPGASGFQCDLSVDSEIDSLFAALKQKYGKLDILVHAVAYAKREDLSGSFVDTSRDGFALAMDVSAYSLVALAREARPYLRRGSSILTLSYYGAEKVVSHYNVMGVAKAALEASVRYLAVDLGPDGIRVNAISAGPIRTLSAGGIADFRKLYGPFDTIAPLRAHITIEDVGKTAVYLGSDLSSAVTGEVVYVDGGFNILGVPTLD